MAYDAPRPRATEKDTKVLQWRDLRSAIEKSLMGYVTYVRHSHPVCARPRSENLLR